jgi:hypothetical protein
LHVVVVVVTAMNGLLRTTIKGAKELIHGTSSILQPTASAAITRVEAM